MTDTDSHPALYIYGPNGEELAFTILSESSHVPREGEQIALSDHTGDAADRGTRYTVEWVETEFRLTETLQGGEAYTQLVYIHTEESDRGQR